MAIPDYQTIMLPLLEFLADGKEHNIREAIDCISDRFRLSERERKELLPSGKQPVIDNRVGWARTYMLKAGLLESPSRGNMRITGRGSEVLSSKPTQIDVKFLERFPEFIEFRTIKRTQTQKDSKSDAETQDIDSVTPDELMEEGYNSIQASLSKELLDKIRWNAPAFFEKVVLDLLSSMGYGEGEVTGRSGDGGIDGSISQDKLGLDKIHFQAKRFGEGTTVTASMVRDFLGALDISGVNKGVLMTTSRFAGDADKIVAKSQKSVVLIDGPKLAKLMIDFNIGVSNAKTYEIKKIDSDYFVDE